MKNYSIAKKVLTIFVLVTTGIISTTFIAAVTGANYFLKKTTIDYTFRLVSQVEDTVIDYQDSMKNIANAILSDKTIADYIYDEIEDDKKVIQTLNFAATTRDDVTNIFAMRLNEDDSLDIVCNDSMKKINKFANYYESTWYKALIDGGKDSVITSSYVQNLVEDQYNWVISLGVAIKGENDRTIGIILIDLNYSSIKNICDDVMPENQGYIYLLSEDGQIVYHPHQQLIFNKVKVEDTSIVMPINNDYVQNGDKIYVVLNSHRYKWKTVAVLDETIVYRNTIINTVVFATLGLIFIAISVFISFIFSNW
jgi:two-component system sensor histidine kinase YesM